MAAPHKKDDTTRTVSRRRFLQLGTILLSAAGSLLSGCTSWLKQSPPEPRPFPPLDCAPAGPNDFDYIVVGSGAGGGPLAANLALAGFRVLLLEAGGDDEPCDYRVPAFHPRATENERLRWDFFVRHYTDETRQSRDEKYRREKGGVLYPRSGTLGGCTAHNAMIFIYPHNSDWDHIARITGDQSWNSENMRRYFERLERCEYVDGCDTESRHGFDGWLTTNLPDKRLLAEDESLSKMFMATVKESLCAIANPLKRILLKWQGRLDPNDWRLVNPSAEGICQTPLTVTRKGVRVGSREYIRRVQSACPDNLEVRTHALATAILFDDTNTATGVKYLSGEHLYRADPRHGDSPGEERTEYVNREVIVCGGAFNTPQLLKLSGIGPQEELERHGIEVIVDLPGVGENLQDRYEVSVVTRLKKDISIIKGMKFRCPEGEEPDPQFRDWLLGEGPYTANGAAVALMKRSFPDRPEPDLFIFGLIGYFKGYFPGYSDWIAKREDYFTWAVLKGHTNNRAGSVALRSADPRDTPEINFRYFEEGSDTREEDLESVVAGVETVRSIIQRCRDEGVIAEEVFPRESLGSREAIRRFVKDNAWGHHASCTCKMGPKKDRMAVVDSRFRVHGTRNLRIVDASVFPKIPGFFIVSAVYMISEKASDTIIQDAYAAESQQAKSHAVTHKLAGLRDRRVRGLGS